MPDHFFWQNGMKTLWFMLYLIPPKKTDNMATLSGTPLPPLRYGMMPQDSKAGTAAFGS